MKIDGYSCDGCGKTRGEGNHWLIAGEEDGVWLAVRHWDDGSAKIAGYKHFCGQGCFWKFQSAWLTKLSI